MAQVVAHDQCILQDGHVVEAVCVKCKNCGGKFDVSPRQLLKAALGGFPPRELCYECTKQARAAAEAAYEEKLKERRTLPPVPPPPSVRGGGEGKAGAGGDEHESPPAPDLQSLVQDLQRQLRDLQRRLEAAEKDVERCRAKATTEAAKLRTREEVRPVADQPPRSGGGSSGAGQSTAKETQPEAGSSTGRSAVPPATTAKPVGGGGPPAGGTAGGSAGVAQDPPKTPRPTMPETQTNGPRWGRPSTRQWGGVQVPGQIPTPPTTTARGRRGVGRALGARPITQRGRRWRQQGRRRRRGRWQPPLPQPWQLSEHLVANSEA